MNNNSTVNNHAGDVKVHEIAAVEMVIPDERTLHERIDAIVGKYNYEKRWLISILFDIQNEYNYLPRDALTYLSERLEAPLSKVYSIATFFKAFTLKPRGRTHVTVCLGTACHVRGAVRVLEEIERSLDLKPGETSSDGAYSLETVNCLGSCALGPIVVINEKYNGRMTTSQVKNLLKVQVPQKG